MARAANIGAMADLEGGQAINTSDSYTPCLFVTLRTAVDGEDYITEFRDQGGRAPSNTRCSSAPNITEHRDGGRARLGEDIHRTHTDGGASHDHADDDPA